MLWMQAVLRPVDWWISNHWSLIDQHLCTTVLPYSWTNFKAGNLLFVGMYFAYLNSHCNKGLDFLSSNTTSTPSERETSPAQSFEVELSVQWRGMVLVNSSRADVLLTTKGSAESSVKLLLLYELRVCFFSRKAASRIVKGQAISPYWTVMYTTSTVVVIIQASKWAADGNSFHFCSSRSCN